MSPLMMLFLIIVFATTGYFTARKRAIVMAGGDSRKLASLPGFYGQNAAYAALIPGFAVFLAGSILTRISLQNGMFGLWADLITRFPGLVPLLAVLASAAALAYAVLRTRPDFRARVAAESWVLSLLIAAASIAILTTVAIVFSMLFETVNFFGQYSWTEFLFGTTWAPDFRGNSALGILPLLWGTLYISFVALLFAVPVGLFAAIYLSEYAGPKLRAVAKPMIEILAGIPTIVYGLFALITVGPMIRDWLAQPLGLGSSGSSVLTAGLVMGVMLIPFVSSLSDDIINAVPQAMRDGSLGLGATKSETIRQVVIPPLCPALSARSFWPPVARLVRR